jgi:hypothetical protein
MEKGRGSRGKLDRKNKEIGWMKAERKRKNRKTRNSQSRCCGTELVPGLKQGWRVEVGIKDVFAAEWEHKDLAVRLQ